MEQRNADVQRRLQGAAGHAAPRLGGQRRQRRERRRGARRHRRAACGGEEGQALQAAEAAAEAAAGGGRRRPQVQVRAGAGAAAEGVAAGARRAVCVARHCSAAVRCCAAGAGGAPPPSGASYPAADAGTPFLHHRDRARERREGANPDFEDAEAELAARGIRAEALGGLSIADSKFLGGDMAHTHLVKGLDYALLQQVGRQGRGRGGAGRKRSGRAPAACEVLTTRLRSCPRPHDPATGAAQAAEAAAAEGAAPGRRRQWRRRGGVGRGSGARARPRRRARVVRDRRRPRAVRGAVQPGRRAAVRSSGARDVPAAAARVCVRFRGGGLRPRRPQLGAADDAAALAGGLPAAAGPHARRHRCRAARPRRARVGVRVDKPDRQGRAAQAQEEGARGGDQGDPRGLHAGGGSV
jgi:hypothetical protein